MSFSQNVNLAAARLDSESETTTLSTRADGNTTPGSTPTGTRHISASDKWPMDLKQVLDDFATAEKLEDGLPEESAGEEIWKKHIPTKPRACTSEPTSPLASLEELPDVVDEWKKEYYSLYWFDDDAELERLTALLLATPQVDINIHSPRAALPCPPPQASTSDRLFMLGWAHTQRWHKIFLRACINTVAKEIAEMHRLDTASHGINQLYLRSGYQLWRSPAVLPDIPEWSDEFGNTYFERLPITDILIVRTSQAWLPGPTEAQYGWLKSILGEPRWFYYPFSAEQGEAIHKPGF